MASSSSEIVPAEDTNPAIMIPQVDVEAIEKPTSSNFPNHPKKKIPSISFPRLRNIFKTSGKRSEPSKSEEENKLDDIQEEAEALSKMIKADLMFIDDTMKRIKHHGLHAERALKMFEDLEDLDGNRKDLHTMKTVVKALKQQITTDRLEAGESDLGRQLEAMSRGRSYSYGANIDGLGDLFDNLYFERTSEYKDLAARFEELPPKLKLCLFSFSIFPENSEIKRRIMINWWIGEEFVPLGQVLEEDSGKTPEDWGNDYFNMLVKVGFLESADEKPKPKVNICRMQPIVRLFVNNLAAKYKFFEFDSMGNVNEECSKSLRACLLKGKKLTINKPLENLHTVFNVNEGLLDFSYELLSRMKNVNVLYLGRWQSSISSQIEIVSRKISKARNSNNALDALEYMKHLRLLSLRGISRIRNLPTSIFKLNYLTILDIRACRDLQKIPEEIGYLVNLTHLDMSECYLLNEMPKGISLLTKLQVLKGFICGDSDPEAFCNLDDLKLLNDLRNLSVHTASDLFPSDKDLRALNHFRKLIKLTISWRRSSVNEKGEELYFHEQISQKKDSSSKGGEKIVDVHQRIGEENSRNTGSEKDRINRTSHYKRDERNSDLKRLLAMPRTGSIERFYPELPPQLKKLDLQCYPGITMRDWLSPSKLINLEKLYIRGGDLFDLGQVLEFEDHGGKENWRVEELKLKYLNDLEMDWVELLEIFPKLTYLEKVNCPKLRSFSCDAGGIWMKETIT